MSQRQTRRRPPARTIITDENIHMLVSDYIDNDEFNDEFNDKLPADLREIPIGDWDVSKVTNMDMLFAMKTFNQSLNNWNVSNVKTMYGMFENATEFNQDLSNWNVSKVTDMSHMFENATSFNKPLNSWNVSSVTNMSHMFENATSFNQDLRQWDVSNVEKFNSMFENARNFNINPNWNIDVYVDTEDMFTGSGVVFPPPYQGVAYEIHDAFDNFKFDKFMEIIQREITARPPAPYLLFLFEEPDIILYPIIAYTFKQTGLTQQEKEEKISKLVLIERTIENYSDFAANRQKIIDVLKFVITQPGEFIDAYIQTLLTDCLKAYSTGRQESCVKGMYERVYFSIRDAIATMCLDQMQGTGAAPEKSNNANTKGSESVIDVNNINIVLEEDTNSLCKPVYIELFECFYETWPKEEPGGLNEMAQEWFGDGAEVSALSPENRIESFVNFVRNKINNEMLFRQAEVSIRKYAIDDLNALFLLGGKKRRKRSIKKLSNKKSIKKRSTKKRKY